MGETPKPPAQPLTMGEIPKAPAQPLKPEPARPPAAATIPSPTAVDPFNVPTQPTSPSTIPRPRRPSILPPAPAAPAPAAASDPGSCRRRAGPGSDASFPSPARGTLDRRARGPFRP